MSDDLIDCPLVKNVREWECIPHLWGIAWLDHARREAVCMPIPLNKIAAAIRRFYLWLTH